MTRLQEAGAHGLVISPYAQWGRTSPEDIPAGDIAAYRGQVQDHGLRILALHGLTTGLPAENIASPETVEHLKRQAQLAGDLGATTMILSSPRLREGAIDYDKAVLALLDVAEVAADNGTRLCLQPLSRPACTFIQTTDDGVRLMEHVAASGYSRTGLGLHLSVRDVASEGRLHPEQTIVNALLATTVNSASANAPGLAPPSTARTIRHNLVGAALVQGGFAGFVTVEMKPLEDHSPIETIDALCGELKKMKELYGFNARRREQSS